MSDGDLLIKSGGEADAAYSLDNEYQTEPAGEQIETQATAGAATFQIKIENDSDQPGSWIVKAGEAGDAGSRASRTTARPSAAREA